MKSIQYKFILLILGCLILSTSVIGTVGILYARHVLNEEAVELMNLRCRDNVKTVDNLLLRIEQSVDTLYAFAENQLADTARFRTDPGYVDECTRKIEDVAVNAALSTEGAVSVYLRYNPAVTDPVSGMFYVRSSETGEYEKTELTDLSLYDPSDTERVGWYYEPIRAKEAIWMGPYQNKNIDVWMISYIIPIFIDHTEIGIIGMDIDFNRITELVRNTKSYKSGYAFLTDEDANIIYHQELPAYTSLDELHNGELKEMAAYLRMDSGNKMLYNYTYNGVRKKMTFASMENGMRMVLTAPKKEIDEQADRLILLIAGASLGIEALAVILTIIMTRRLVRPLGELNQAARKIAGGDLSIEISHHSKDEIGMLADSFRLTVSHLKNYIDYINGLAYRDGLTGLKNKTAYMESVKKLDELIRLKRPAFAVAVFDVNDLKITNDRMGHDFGDLLIIETSRILSRTFRNSPVYRIGGDEFAVILENGDYENYTLLLERFSRYVEEYNREPGVSFRISVARGIAEYNESVDLCYQDVFKRADDAMYRNKSDMKSAKNMEETAPRQYCR